MTRLRELVVRAVLDLEHPGREELRERGEPARIGQLGQHPGMVGGCGDLFS